MIPVIICGGVGSKMWPESRQKSPKQFLPLVNGKSLFEINYETLRKKFAASEIFLQTNPVQAEMARKQKPEMPVENIFIEPEMRNQGPATGMAAAMLYKLGFKDEPFILIQVDVLREPEEDFFKMIDQCDELVRKEGKLMTGGYRPPFAMMGCDYLIRGDKVEGTGEVIVWRMEKWLGRDTKEEVESFLKDGKALLHSNHYAWTPRLMLEAIKKRKVEWYEPLMNIANGGDVATEYAKMPKGPIEEVTKFEMEEGLVVEHAFKWIDFGTWESVAKYLEEKGMYSPEDVEEIETKNNFVRKPRGKYVALIGMEDTVVIDTGDALLVMKKEQSGKVGQIVDKLKEKGRTELL